MNIDKIYKMLSWDNDISVQLCGIKEAQKIKSLWVFILPLLSSNSKSIWGNCAKILVSKSNSELKPYLTELLKWLQDMNWPGASLMYDRLSSIPIDELELPLKICQDLANKTNDKPWENSLNALKNDTLKNSKNSS